MSLLGILNLRVLLPFILDRLLEIIIFESVRPLSMIEIFLTNYMQQRDLMENYQSLRLLNISNWSIYKNWHTKDVKFI